MAWHQSFVGCWDVEEVKDIQGHKQATWSYTNRFKKSPRQNLLVVSCDKLSPYYKWPLLIAFRKEAIKGSS